MFRHLIMESTFPAPGNLPRKVLANDALITTLAALEYLRIHPIRLTISVELDSVVGGYGEVMHATLDADTPNASQVAVKELRPAGNRKERTRLAVRLVREIKVWATLDHPNILRLVGFHLNEDMTIAQLVSPFESHGHIAEYLEKTNPNAANRLCLAIDTVKGLEYLHNLTPPICHGDLKAHNVLVGADRRAKLCDFGLATAMDGVPSGLTTSKRLNGSTRYLSPELLREEVFCRTLKSDIWALGCLLLGIISNACPYSHITFESRLIYAITKGELPARLDVLAIPAQLVSLLKSCWSILVELRPTARECLDILLDTATSISTKRLLSYGPDGTEADVGTVSPSASALTESFFIPPQNDRVDESIGPWHDESSPSHLPGNAPNDTPPLIGDSSGKLTPRLAAPASVERVLTPRLEEDQSLTSAGSGERGSDQDSAPQRNFPPLHPMPGGKLSNPSSGVSGAIEATSYTPDPSNPWLPSFGRDHSQSRSSRPSYTTTDKEFSLPSPSSVSAVAPSDPPSDSPLSRHLVGRGPHVTSAHSGESGHQSRPSGSGYERSALTLDDFWQRTIKVRLSEPGFHTQGSRRTIDMAECETGIDVLHSILRKFEKGGGPGHAVSGDNTSQKRGETEGGGLTVDGWGVFLEESVGETSGIPLTEAELLAVRRTAGSSPVRDRLMLRRVQKAIPNKPTAFSEQPRPTPPQPSQTKPAIHESISWANLSGIFDDSGVNSDGSLAAPPTPPIFHKTYRASTDSVMSGLGADAGWAPMGSYAADTLMVSSSGTEIAGSSNVEAQNPTISQIPTPEPDVGSHKRYRASTIAVVSGLGAGAAWVWMGSYPIPKSLASAGGRRIDGGASIKEQTWTTPRNASTWSPGETNASRNVFGPRPPSDIVTTQRQAPAAMGILEPRTTSNRRSFHLTSDGDRDATPITSMPFTVPFLPPVAVGESLSESLSADFSRSFFLVSENI